MEEFYFDILILGGGPAGLSAAIYGARGGSKVGIIDTSVAGGQPNYYQSIDNYPGYLGLESFQLVNSMVMQAEKFGTKIFECQTVRSVGLENKEVVTSEATFKARSIVIATGVHPKLLGIPGEKEFVGKGVSYCAICDGAFYKDKEVAVIGGGNSALEEACYLTKFAKKVYILHRRDKLRADRVVQERAFNNPKIEIWFNCDIHEIEGDTKVRSIYFHEEGEPVRLEVNGVFPYIGMVANTELINPWRVNMNENGFIIVNETMNTSCEGIYAVGDVIEKPVRQVVTAVSDGAIVGVQANKYLDLVGRY